MSFINFLIENWQLIIIAIAVVAVAIYVVYAFVKMPRSAQISRLQEWLLYAVAEAEKSLGSGTGQLKLRYVYDMFVGRFPALARIISFEAFSLLVDKALDKFNELLSSNKKVDEYVHDTTPTVAILKPANEQQQQQ